MNRHRSKLTGLMALTVFTLFALCLLLVLLTGAEGYRKLVDRSGKDYGRRTAARYLTTRVRQAEGVRTEEFAGLDALVLEETVDSQVYTTRVYCHGGWLRELYTAGGSFSPEDGEKILEAEALALNREASLLRLKLTLPEGELLELYLQFPGAQEVVP